jgi:hypothetical protein
MIFFLITLVSASNLQVKEEACYLLSSYLVRESQEDIIDHAKEYKIKEPELRFKIIELGYNKCMKSISDDEIGKFNSKNKKEFTNFRHLIKVKFDHLTTSKDIKLTPEFLKVRNEVGKRVSFTKKTEKSDL